MKLLTLKFEPQMNRGQKGLVGMLMRNALETLSPFIVLILLSCAAFGQAPGECKNFGSDLTMCNVNDVPNAPSAGLRLSQATIDGVSCSVESPCYLGNGSVSKSPVIDNSIISGTHQSDVITVDDIKEQGFWRGHPTRTKLIIAAIGGGIGLTIALVTRHNCPKYINGYRYDGTPPCPGPDYDPGDKRSVGVRWRF